jgi:hypothetical protein
MKEARGVWLPVLANTLILLVLIAAVLTPLGLMLVARYAQAQGELVPPWADVTRPGTQRALVAGYAVLVVLQIAERFMRGEVSLPLRRRGATMAPPGSRLVPAPPTAEPEGSAYEKGSRRNGRQVSEGHAEEEPRRFRSSRLSLIQRERARTAGPGPFCLP